MPDANNQGVNVHYEVDGDAGLPTVVCHHGAGGSSADWREFGYSAALRDNYRLAMLDARGYGGSGRPHDAADFAPEVLAADVVAVLDDLGVEKGIYWGYSMGANVGLRAVSQHASDRFKAFIFGGNGVFPSADSARLTSSFRTFFEVGARDGMAAALALFEESVGQVSPERGARFLTIDPHSFLARRAAGEAKPFDPALLSNIAAPTLLYAGDADQVYESARRTAEAIPSARFVSLPGLNHLQAYSQSQFILPAVREFLASID